MKTIKRILVFVSATVRFALFWAWAALHIPLMLINPGGRWGALQLKILMRGAGWLCGLRYKIYGQLSDARPLLLIGNHISVFEFMAIPAALGANFFGKQEIAKMPLVGWAARKMGVQFIDRNPAKAQEMTRKIKNWTTTAKWPMAIFPEGTSTDGANVIPFKSALFRLIEPQLGGDASVTQFTVQPFVMFFRRPDGSHVSDHYMAHNYASFNKDTMMQYYNSQPEKKPTWDSDFKMLGDFAQVFHVMKLGGILVEIHLLPPPPLAEIKDRKQLASSLHKIVSDKYNKLK